MISLASTSLLSGRGKVEWRRNLSRNDRSVRQRRVRQHPLKHPDGSLPPRASLLLPPSLDALEKRRRDVLNHKCRHDEGSSVSLACGTPVFIVSRRLVAPCAKCQGCQMILYNGPPGAASCSTRRATSGSSSSGGAWCGLMRASITSEPVQPQCFCWVNAPMPYTSAAGLERVNVTHRKLLSVRAVKALSSTSTISGKALIGSSGRNAAQKRSTSGEPGASATGVLRSLTLPARSTSTASTPGRPTRRSPKPRGRRKSTRTSRGSTRRLV